MEVRLEWALDDEDMGTKRKFWYEWRSPDEKWLFKYPRPDTGEHWAEKIAAEIARLLDIPHARVELATCHGQRGSATKSFRHEKQKLIHGNHRESFLPALRKIENLDPNAVRETVHRVPGEWMSCSERRFSIEMMTYGHAQLQELYR